MKEINQIADINVNFNRIKTLFYFPVTLSKPQLLT